MLRELSDYLRSASRFIFNLYLGLSLSCLALDPQIALRSAGEDCGHEGSDPRGQEVGIDNQPGVSGPFEWSGLVTGKWPDPSRAAVVVAYFGSARLRKSSNSGTVNAVSPWAGL